jgi:CTP synthase
LDVFYRVKVKIVAKYIIVCGGVVSGCGKGIAAASIALLMRQRGHSVQCVKFDPYLNVDAGVLSPHEHGEVFLCEDGHECDMDLGHYERIAGITTSKLNILTSGALYKELINEQEHGKWLGSTIQIIPHVTNKIIERLEEVGKLVDTSGTLGSGQGIVISEIGGTVGDLESGQFYEAVRQFKQKYRDDCLIVMVAPILWMPTVGEFKTKPLQRAVVDLQSHNLQPDMLLCRVDRPIPSTLLDKVANLTNVPREAVIDAPDVSTVYQVPLEFYARHVDDLIVDSFHLGRKGCRIHKYRELVEKYLDSSLPTVTIGVFGKYNNASEAYISLKEACYHAGVANDVRVQIRWISSEDVEKSDDLKPFFKELNGVIIPGGFDSRGIEGKIKAIQYARENKIPFLGICLGLQCAVIEFARHVCNLVANSIEFDKDTLNPVIHYVAGQEKLTKKAATMRLGAYDCDLEKDTIVREVYKKKSISERHRHRYEVNGQYTEQYAQHGLIVSGRNPQSNLIEMMELKRELHPYFVGTQSHPEFRSRFEIPAPLFDGLIKAAKVMLNG